MNGKKIIKVVREVKPEWDEIMRLAEQIDYGEIIIKIHQRKIVLWEYHIKRKEGSRELETIPL